MVDKNKQNWIRRSGFPRPPFLSKRSGGRRAKKIHFKSLNLTISFRSFKTSRASRTKIYNQIVLPFPFIFKEIAITSRRKKLFFAKLPQMASGLLITAIFLGGLIYFALNLYGTPDISINTTPKVKAASVSLPAAKSLPRSDPVELRIRAINVDTALAKVGLKPDGSLDVPADFHIAGWYTGSPTPGELGPSIIDGHVDNHEGLGVFWYLRNLNPGDVIEVVRADGSIANFKVDSLQQFPQSSFPTKAVYGKINYAGLRLITCGGIFNPASHHYSDNIVVFASLQ